MTDLRPCPFCGSTDVRVVVEGEHSLAYWVECNACSASGPEHYERDKGKEKAARLWNTRVLVEPTEDELNDEIKRFIDNMKPKESK